MFLVDAVISLLSSIIFYILIAASLIILISFVLYIFYENIKDIVAELAGFIRRLISKTIPFVFRRTIKLLLDLFVRAPFRFGRMLIERLIQSIKQFPKRSSEYFRLLLRELSSDLRYRLNKIPPPFGPQSRPPSRIRRASLLFSGTAEGAVEASLGRQSFIRRNIEASLTTDGEVGEILELPPDYGDELLDSQPLGKNEAIGQRIRLSSELEEESLRLLGRVVDAVIIITRQLHKQRKTRLLGRKFALPDVSMRVIEEDSHQHGASRWVAIIGTKYRSQYSKRLRELEKWLGIGVAIAPPIRTRSFLKCHAAKGARGASGGVLIGTTGGQSHEIALTCSHVLGKSCTCRMWPNALPTTPEPITASEQRPIETPDVALVRVSGSCSDRKHFRHYSRWKFPGAAQYSDLENARVAKKPVFRMGGKSPSREGELGYDISLYPTELGWFRFPAVQVSLKMRYWFFGLIPMPVFRRQFSHPGDSGSWLLMPMASSDDWIDWDLSTYGEQPWPYAIAINFKWVGLIVAGSKFHRDTVVLRADKLISYFEEISRSDPNFPQLECNVMKLFPQ